MPVNWEQLLAMAIPTAVGGAVGGMPAATGAMEGYERGRLLRQRETQQQQALARQQQLDEQTAARQARLDTRAGEYQAAQIANLEADNRRQQEAAETAKRHQAVAFLLERLPGIAESTPDLNAAMTRAAQMSAGLEQSEGLKQGTLAPYLAGLSLKRQQFLQREARERLKEAESYEDKASSLTVGEGPLSGMTVAQVRELAGMSFKTPTGQAAKPMTAAERAAEKAKPGSIEYYLSAPPEEQAAIRKAKHELSEAAHVTVVNPGATNSRMDRSYQFNVGQITTMRKPLADQVERITRLKATIDQNSPAADALIAPELLTVMAGGQGSGLRMNEAEIARIIGGRNAWEDIKSKALRWQSDPSKPFQLLPSQRAQIRKLVDEVVQRNITRQSILDDAEEKLIDAPDPTTHRRVVAETRKKLSEEQKQSSAGTPLGQPAKVNPFR